MAKFKEVLAILQSLLTIGAILAAAVWFSMQATAEPKAQIKHEARHRQLSKDYVWLRVETSITNIGKRPLHLPTGIFRVQQVLPLHENYRAKLKSDTLIDTKHKVVLWPQFEGGAYTKEIDLTIYPGETDVLDCEFIIPAEAETVKIYSFFPVGKDAKQGWKGSLIYDVPKGEK